MCRRFHSARLKLKGLSNNNFPTFHGMFPRASFKLKAVCVVKPSLGCGLSLYGDGLVPEHRNSAPSKADEAESIPVGSLSQSLHNAPFLVVL